MLHLLILGSCALLCSSVVVTYEKSYLPIKATYKAGGNEFEHYIDLNYPDYYFFGPECKEDKICVYSGTENIYDPVANGATKLPSSPFKQTYEKSQLEGDVYEGYLGSDIIGTQQKFKFPVAKKVTPYFYLSTPVIGLGFETKIEDKNIVKTILAKHSEHQIIIRRGPFGHSLKGKYLPGEKVHGKYSIGEKTMDGCEEFKFFKTAPGKGWTLKGTIKIGAKSYPDIDVKVSTDKGTTVPKAVYDTHFANLEKEEDLPEFSFTPDGTNIYKIERDNMIHYNAAGTKFDTSISRGDSFILGQSFFSQYCLSLKTDDKFGNTEVGFAESKRLKTDAKWLDDDNNEIPYDDDDDKGGDGGKGEGGDKGGDDGKGGKGGDDGKGDGGDKGGDDGKGGKGGDDGKGDGGDKGGDDGNGGKGGDDGKGGNGGDDGKGGDDAPPKGDDKGKTKLGTSVSSSILPALFLFVLARLF